MSKAHNALPGTKGIPRNALVSVLHFRFSPPLSLPQPLLLCFLTLSPAVHPHGIGPGAG